MNEAELNEQLNKIGSGVKVQLERHWTDWKLPLTFKSSFNKYYAKAEKLGISVDELVVRLEQMGFCTIISVPSVSGRRYVFPGGLTESRDELLSLVQEIENNKELEKQFNKL